MQSQINIVQVNVSELKPADYNPRKSSEKETQDLKDSITKFGLLDPIIVNGSVERRNVVIGGHFRLRVAKDLGYLQVPVVYIDIPDVEKEKELNLRLNKNQGSWDLLLLSKFDPGLLRGVGFAHDDMQKIFDASASEDGFNAEEEYSKIDQPVTQPGDLWLLGRHK